MKERCRSSTRGCVKCCFHEYQMCDLGRGETVMEANYFWQSWLSVCFHGKVHSQRHEHSPTASDCSPLDPSLVKCYFEISMWDLCFDSGASNVTLCWSSRENLNSCRITIATIVVSRTKKKAKKKNQYNLLSNLNLWLCVAAAAKSPARCVNLTRKMLKEWSSIARKFPLYTWILFHCQVHAVWDSIRSSPHHAFMRCIYGLTGRK